MPRFILITAMLLVTMPLNATQWWRTSRMRIGIEWGGSGNLVESHHYNYLDSSVGFRIDDTGTDFFTAINGYVSVSAGVDVSRKVSFRIHGGYFGVAHSRRNVPLGAQFTFHPRGTLSDGAFLYAGAGISMRKHESNMGSAVIGTGYRIMLGRKDALDFRVGLRQTYDTPDVWDPLEEVFVPARNIRRNNAHYLALCIGIGIDF